MINRLPNQRSQGVGTNGNEVDVNNGRGLCITGRSVTKIVIITTLVVKGTGILHESLHGTPSEQRPDKEERVEDGKEKEAITILAALTPHRIFVAHLRGSGSAGEAQGRGGLADCEYGTALLVGDTTTIKEQKRYSDALLGIFLLLPSSQEKFVEYYANPKRYGIVRMQAQLW